MALLAAANLQLAFGTRTILDGASLTLERGDHVGLVGRNGCGKSTLMKLLAGLNNLKADDGQIQLARNATVGYLTQDPNVDPDRTLREEAGAAFGELAELHRRLETVAHDMEAAEGDELDRLLKRYQKIEHDIEAAGGYAVDHRIEATLHGLGLPDQFFDVKVRDLSGGQKGRLSLAKLLLADSDVLLLDEPTNHLDIDGREWLEEYLATCNSAVILVSHDRWLLDRVVSRIYELEQGRLIEYPGNYMKYRELREERQLTLARTFDKQQTKIRQEQAFIDRYKAGQRAKQARGRERKLERFKRDEVIERPLEQSAMNMVLRQPKRTGDQVISAENLAKGYEGKPLFADLSLTVKRGDRIGIIGPNGAGKTTLINCLLGKLEPDRGVVRIGSNVSVGYYTQHQADFDPDMTVIEYLKRRVENLSEQEARDLAGAFLFSGIDQDKELGVLSGGERSRAAIAALVAGGHNVLVLDEPTNHLDIPSAERLEESLKQFCRIGQRKQELAGTLLLITHDRMLLEDLVDQLIVFDGEGHAKHMYGTWSDYRRERHQSIQAEAQRKEDEAKRQAEQAKAAEQKKAQVKGKTKASGRDQSAGTQSKPAQKPPRKQKQPASGGRTKRRFSALNHEKLEARIAEIEARLKDIDQELAFPETYRDSDRVQALTSEREELAGELTPLEEEWLLRAEE